MGNCVVKPFLSIVTRTCMRKKFLTENIQSVKAQTCQDIEQVFIVDRARKGIQWADRSFVANRNRVNGEYSYIIDDDCWLIDNAFVERTKKFIEKNNYPQLIMFRSRRPAGPPSNQTVFPTKEVWGKIPKHQTTNCLCYMVKTPLWKKNIHYFGIRAWGGDWVFLESLLKEGHKIHWLDTEPMAESHQLGRGRLFENVEKGWFEQVAKNEGLVNLGDDDWRLQLYLSTSRH